MRKDQSDGKTKKDVDTTATEPMMIIDNDDDVEEIPDDDSVDNAETAS